MGFSRILLGLILSNSVGEGAKLATITMAGDVSIVGANNFNNNLEKALCFKAISLYTFRLREAAEAVNRTELATQTPISSACLLSLYGKL